MKPGFLSWSKELSLLERRLLSTRGRVTGRHRDGPGPRGDGGRSPTDTCKGPEGGRMLLKVLEGRANTAAGWGLKPDSPGIPT